MSMLASCVLMMAMVGQGPQGGAMGGGFGGGGMAMGREADPGGDRSAAAINRQIATYLNVPDASSILTPGEYSEWPLDLKAGQVVIAEAWTDAFDPALEVVQGESTVLASNDDRFPGDQRPLLLWRAEKEGKYLLRGRSFRGRAGGKFQVRFKVFDTLDLSTGKGERATSDRMAVLVRIPMKAGELRQVKITVDGRDAGASRYPTISPIGLPGYPADFDLSSLGTKVVYAPVAGDYYLAASNYRDQAGLRGESVEIVPKAIGHLEEATAGQVAIWARDVKKGEFLEFACSGLGKSGEVKAMRAPNTAGFSLEDAAKNPFYPTPEPEPELLQERTGRVGDGRIAVFEALADGKVWLASGGQAGAAPKYQAKLGPAAKPWPTGAKTPGNLQIGRHDYWQFEAKPGEVIRLKGAAGDFLLSGSLTGPNRIEGARFQTFLDEASAEDLYVVREAGRHVFEVSCTGDSGGGGYTLERESIPPGSLALGKAASGKIEPGQVHVWRLQRDPKQPMLIHWTSDVFGYEVMYFLEDGRQTSLDAKEIDPRNVFGIVNVREPSTVLILLRGNRTSNYKIEVSPLLAR